MTIGHRIRSMRTTQGLSQTKLARAVGLTQGALSQIELGLVRAIKAETLVRLSAAMRTNPQWLQTGKGSPVLEALDSVDESEAIAIYRALTPQSRGAWMAAGRALLDAQPEASPARPYPLPKSVKRV